jgi:hypothetical protein
MPIEKRYPVRFVFTAVAVLASLASGQAASPSKDRIRVAVQVSGYDPPLIEAVTASLVRNLRGFRDVAVVDNEADLHLRILVIENQNSVKSFGYTLSILASRTVPEDFLRSSVPVEARRAFLLRLYGNSETLADNWMAAAPPDGLEDACKKIIATFYWGAFQQVKNPRLSVGEAVYSADSASK